MVRKPESERRAHERVTYSARVELFHEGDAIGAFSSLDLSEGGIQIRGFPLPILSRVKLLVRLASDDDQAEVDGQIQGVVIDGTVAWRTLGRSGIQFVDLTDTTQRILKRVIASKESGELTKPRQGQTTH